MPDGIGSSIVGFLPYIAIFAVLILMMWLPNRKRKKQYQQLMESLQPGKMVKTIGGIYGKIAAVKDDLVTIEVLPDKVRMVFAKGAIATVEDSEADEKTMDTK
jgi:preprotein translocase subunit YajC